MEIIIRAEHIIDDGCIMSRSGNDARTGQALVQKALLEDGNISTEQITTADVKPLRCFFCFLYDRFMLLMDDRMSQLMQQYDVAY